MSKPSAGAATKPKRNAPPPGRPSSYSAELADTICERLAKPESLRSICSELVMPSQSMVFRWLQQHEEFREKYARAREAQAEAMFDEIIDIADDGHNDYMLRNHGENEVWVENGEALRRSQLRVEARKWLAGKLAPKKYGEKSQVEHSGTLTLAQLVESSYGKKDGEK